MVSVKPVYQYISIVPPHRSNTCSRESSCNDVSSYVLHVNEVTLIIILTLLLTSHELSSPIEGANLALFSGLSLLLLLFGLLVHIQPLILVLVFRRLLLSDPSNDASSRLLLLAVFLLKVDVMLV